MTEEFRKYKILQLIDTLDVGGAEKIIILQSNLLAKKGHNVDVLTTVSTGMMGDSLDKHIGKLCLNRGWKYNVIKMFKLSKIIRRYEIVHVHLRHNLKYIWLTKLFFPFRTRIVFQDHTLHTNSIPWILKKMRNKIVYVGVSSALQDFSKNKIGVTDNKTFFLRNTIQKIDYNKNHHKNNGDVLRMVLVSNFRKEKNAEKRIEFSIKLIKHIQKFLQVKLDIYGQINNIEYCNEIVSEIGKNNLENSVRITTNCDNIQAELYKYNIGLHCSKFETGPLVLLDYLCQGLPFVAYDTGEIANHISKYFPYFIIDNYDLNEWYSRISSIIKKERKQLENKMTSFFSEHYSENKYLEQLQYIYQQTML